MHPYSVLQKPVLSEKSNRARENEEKYTFHVDIKANKADVKKAVEKMFDVQVLGVTTSITRGKFRRRGYQVSNRPGKHKKAVVTLAKGQKIQLFEDL